MPLNFDTDLVALSFLQPWLWAILEQHKGIQYDGRFYALENRKWKPPPLLRGRTFALHASRGWDTDGQEFVAEQLPDVLPAVPAGAPRLRRGAILGTARLVGAVKKGGSKSEVAGGIVDALADAAASSRWAFGPWIWLLTDIRLLAEPLPARGALGMWRVPEPIAEILRGLGAA